MARKLTRKQKRAYIQGEGGSCPFCGSSDIEGRSIEIEAELATQPVRCNACEASWTDVYRLIDIVPD